MDDTAAATRPDHESLFAIATEQAGYFTTAQARTSGFSSPLITHHAKSGRFVRIARGLYRLRDYPSSPREELLAAWLRLAPEAVVSHESALELLGLSDIIPNLIHLSVPRTRRKLSRRSGVVLHTTTRPLDGSDVVVRDGMRLSGPARTIADVAEAGVAPEQVVRAAQQAIDRGLTTPSRLREAAQGRGRRVEQLIEILVGQAGEVRLGGSLPPGARDPAPRLEPRWRRVARSPAQIGRLRSTARPAVRGRSGSMGAEQIRPER